MLKYAYIPLPLLNLATQYDMIATDRPPAEANSGGDVLSTLACPADL